jgi:1-aminocyclopropane-1-carboxylate deaminase/D-cysteine desulfhydrase-like pyridoxal-dependent ACC family enzyme
MYARVGGRGRSSRATHHATSSSTTGWINPDALIPPRDLAPVPRDGIGGAVDNNGNNSIVAHDEDGDTKVMHPSPSAVERLLIRDRLVYVKRDDALHLPNSNVCGNKGRKFLHLNDMPLSDFPDVVVSYGGPQSNAMVALAAIVSSKNAEAARSSRAGGTYHTTKGEVGDDHWPMGSGMGIDIDRDFRILDVSEDDEVGKDDDYDDDDDEDGYNISMPTIQQSSSIAPPTTTTTTTTTTTKRFVYYTKTMPRYLRKNPSGNLLRAMALGMEIRTLGHDQYADIFGGLHGGSSLAPADLDPPVPGRSLWIPQGGACGIAMPGSDALASEIVDYWVANGRGMPLAVCVPGGTCTTALLLHRSIRGMLERRRAEGKEREGRSLDIRVIVIPCVGDDEYATRQMQSLDRSVGGKGRIEDMPWVLRPRTDIEYGSARRRSNGYFTFGEPAKAILQTFDEMNEHGLFLDLLYGAPAFSLLLQHWTSRASDCPIAGRQVMYVHSGGLEGIASQLTRYKHKGLIDARTIQTS